MYWVTPSNSFWLLSLAPMLSTFVFHSCIFSCVHSSRPHALRTLTGEAGSLLGSTTVPVLGDTYTDAALFDIIETNGIELALMN
jgi:hypothetical protein